MLHFEIFADEGSIHKETILVEQSRKTENDMWFYKVTLAQTDTSLIFEEYDG
jgi:hypothetical protein